MADGGASTMILLVTSLLLSGAASVVLIESWGEVAKVSGINASGRVANAETDVSFSGDRSDVFLDPAAGSQEITLYFQNTGIRSLDKSSFSIFIDGVYSAPVGATTLYPSSGVWASDHVLQVTVSDASFNYNDSDKVVVTIVVQSTISEGVKGTSSETAEVKLNV
jgi:archaellum component FlaG (FlaF/FlaG flagellin family)